MVSSKHCRNCRGDDISLIDPIRTYPGIWLKKRREKVEVLVINFFPQERVALLLATPSVVQYKYIPSLQPAGSVGSSDSKGYVLFDSEGRHCGQVVLQLAALCTN